MALVAPGRWSVGLTDATLRFVSADDRGLPLPETEGEELLRQLLDEISEEEALSRAVGVDLTPAPPDPSHAPLVFGPLQQWLERSEEVHRFRELAHRAERRRFA